MGEDANRSNNFKVVEVQDLHFASVILNLICLLHQLLSTMTKFFHPKDIGEKFNPNVLNELTLYKLCQPSKSKTT